MVSHPCEERFRVKSGHWCAKGEDCSFECESASITDTSVSPAGKMAVVNQSRDCGESDCCPEHRDTAHYNPYDRFHIPFSTRTSPPSCCTALPTRLLERLSMLENVVKISTHDPTRLTSRMRSIANAMSRANAYSALNTSTPIAAALSIRRYQAILLILLLFFVYWSVVSVQVLSKRAMGSGQHFWLNITNTRGDSSAFQLEDFHLLVNGCRLKELPSANSTSLYAIVLSFHASVLINGFSFRTSRANPINDRLRFALYSTSAVDPSTLSSDWAQVGSSEWSYSATGELVLNDNDEVLNLTGIPGELLSFDLRPSWLWVMAKVCPSIVNSVGFLLTFMAGLAGREFLGKWILVGSWTIVSTIYLIVGTTCVVGSKGMHEELPDCILWLVSAGGSASVPIMLVLAERHAVLTLLLMSGIFLVVLVGMMNALHRAPVEWMVSVSTLALVLIAIGVWIRIFHSKVVERTALLVEPDLLRYEEMWKRILADGENVKALADLVTLTKSPSCTAAKSRRSSTFESLRSITNEVWTSAKSFHCCTTCETTMSIGTLAKDSESGLCESVGRPIRARESLVRAAVHSASEYWKDDDCKVVRQMCPQIGSPARHWDVEMSSHNGVLFLHDAARMTDRTGADGHGQKENLKPVASLDQLYMQASGLYPILRSKVQDWAEVSSGLFPLRPNEEVLLSGKNEPKNSNEFTKRFVRWDEARQDEDCLRQIKWATLKGVDRAIEKAFRSYKGDVSRLVDVCRQSIIFENLRDLCICFRIILNDSEVKIIRIKNRLDPAYDSKVAAGYRDICINLCLTSQDSTWLGLSHHVCEVQLLLREFAELKSDDGHKRYVTFRNARGE